MFLWPKKKVASESKKSLGHLRKLPLISNRLSQLDVSPYILSWSQWQIAKSIPKIVLRRWPKHYQEKTLPLSRAWKSIDFSVGHLTPLLSKHWATSSTDMKNRKTVDNQFAIITLTTIIDKAQQGFRGSRLLLWPRISAGGCNTQSPFGVKTRIECSALLCLASASNEQIS